MAAQTQPQPLFDIATVQANLAALIAENDPKNDVAINCVKDILAKEIAIQAGDPVALARRDAHTNWARWDRRYTGRRMTAKFDGRCRCCGGNIVKGDKMRWARHGGAYHDDSDSCADQAESQL